MPWPPVESYYDESVATLTERLLTRGWRMTAQRRVIFGVFDGTDQGGTGRQHDKAEPDIHLTADEVLERAVAQLSEISRATVYNTLGELVDAGELLAVNVGDRVTRYDPNVHMAHDHLVCTACGAIFDIPAGAVALPDQSCGFTISSAEVIYRGRCADCS